MVQKPFCLKKQLGLKIQEVYLIELKNSCKLEKNPGNICVLKILWKLGARAYKLFGFGVNK